MSYALVKYDFPGGNVKPLCEYAIETASDLTSLPATDISPNSVAITPNGALYRLSVSGDWVFDTSTYGGSADLLGELPHVLNLSQGDNSTLVVKKSGSPVSDGDLVYYGDVLNVAFTPLLAMTLCVQSTELLLKLQATTSQYRLVVTFQLLLLRQ